MNPRRTITFVLTMALAAPLFAQRMGEAVQVTVVEVPVTVVDRDGKAVPGLTAESFELYDEGKRVPIEYFDVLDLTSTAKTADAPAEALPPAATRHFLLLFDLANSSPGTIGRAREAATAFVTRDLGPRDLAAIATFTAEAGARMVTNFTRDKRLLSNAIETLGHPNYFRVADPLMISANVGAHSQTESGPGAAIDAEAIFAELTADQQRLAQTAHAGEMRNRLRIQFWQGRARARSSARAETDHPAVGRL
jgi:VWFA-related protein